MAFRLPVALLCLTLGTAALRPTAGAIRARASTPRASAALSLLSTFAGQPSAVPALRERVAAGDQVDELIPQLFSFALDSFQTDALLALNDGQSVVVSAPTGSGKTVVGELAVYLALAKGERVVYTTPLKALSNQKYYDFQRQFGAERVGLLTGDASVNREADILVMTTEIFRNMLLSEEHVDGSDDPLSGVSAAVLDEFHYMNEPSRGTVWEESCILCPERVQLIALSATMSNAQKIVEWLGKIHGPTQLIASEFRPVPLRYYFADSLGVEPLFSSSLSGPGASPDAPPAKLKARAKVWKMNRELLPGQRDAAHAQREVRAASQGGGGGRGGGGGGERGGGGGRGRGRGRGRSRGDEAFDEFGGARGRGRGRGYGGGGGGGGLEVRKLPQTPSNPFLLRRLARKEMLPAIFFIFSRVGCERAAEEVALALERGLLPALLSPGESERVTERVNEFREQNPELPIEERRAELLAKGLGVHHAGMLPLEKKIVEGLFQDGLLRAVFATETLSAGINMPARCTVVTNLAKRGDNGIEPLAASNLLQMAGRAGRRGKDDIGHVVLCRSKFEGAAEAHGMLLRPPDPISSHFFVTYGGALKMLRTRPLEQCRDLVLRSFGAVLSAEKGESARERQAEAASELQRVAADLEQAEALLARHDEDAARDYAKLAERLVAEQRLEGILVEQDTRAAAEVTESLLPYVQVGAAVLLRGGDGDGDGDGGGTSALLLDDASPQLAARLASAATAAADVAAAGMGGGGRRGELGDLGGGAGGAAVLLLTGAGDVRCAGPLQIESLLPEEGCILPSEARTALLQSLPKAAAWGVLLDGSLEVAGGASAAALAQLVPKLAPAEPPPAIEKQRGRVAWVRSQLEAMPLHTEPERNGVLRALAARDELRGNAKKLRRRRDEAANAAAPPPPPLGASAADELGSLEAQSASGRGGVWEQFLAVAQVLQTYGALDAQGNTTAFGELVGALSGDNELWLALVMIEVADKETLTPPQLAALLSSTLDERMRPNSYVAYAPSDEVLDAVDELEVRGEDLELLQDERGLAFKIALEPGLVGLVEAWASGVEWRRLMGGTSLDPGDVYRLLRRTLELLRQVSLVPYVSEGVARRARDALRAMDRYPLADNAILGAAVEEEAAPGQVEASQ